MRDDRGRVVYDQSGPVKYHPKNGTRDGQIKKKKKPPSMRWNSLSPPTMPMATSTPATRASTRTRTTPRHLQDYIHGAELDSDSLGLLPVQDYDQSDLSNLCPPCFCHINMCRETKRGIISGKLTFLANKRFLTAAGPLALTLPCPSDPAPFSSFS
jgi:hypothetical protein